MSQENPTNPEEEAVLGLTRAAPTFKEIILSIFSIGTTLS